MAWLIVGYVAVGLIVGWMAGRYFWKQADYVASGVDVFMATVQVVIFGVIWPVSLVSFAVTWLTTRPNNIDWQRIGDRVFGVKR